MNCFLKYIDFVIEIIPVGMPYTPCKGGCKNCKDNVIT